MYGKTVAEFFDKFKDNVFHRWVNKEEYEKEIDKKPGTGEYPNLTRETTDFDEAKLMTSKRKNGNHYFIADLDVEAYLIPSSTPGHSHLIICEEINWWEFDAIMSAMADAGIVEPGYHRATRKRTFSTIRLPWVKKGEEPWNQ